MGLILTWTRVNVFRYIACCIIHLIILFNIFNILNCIQGDHATMHMIEGTAMVFTYNIILMGCLAAARYNVNYFVQLSTYCDEQQFHTLLCALYTIFSV